MMLGNGICLLACALYLSFWHRTPDRIKIRAGEREEMNLALPASGMLRASGDKAIPVSLDRTLMRKTAMTWM